MTYSKNGFQPVPTADGFASYCSAGTTLVMGGVSIGAAATLPYNQGLTTRCGGRICGERSQRTLCVDCLDEAAPGICAQMGVVPVGAQLSRWTKGHCQQMMVGVKDATAWAVGEAICGGRLAPMRFQGSSDGGLLEEAGCCCGGHPLDPFKKTLLYVEVLNLSTSGCDH